MPADFGRFSNDLLVGNFGDGAINAYDLASGEFRRRLRSARGVPIVIDGPRGISFGNGVQNQPANVLFFTAGPAGEAHGLFGRIEAAPRDEAGTKRSPEARIAPWCNGGGERVASGDAKPIEKRRARRPPSSV